MEDNHPLREQLQVYARGCPSQDSVNGVILNDMSDHLPIFSFFSSESVPHNREVQSYRRDHSEQNLMKFRNGLSQVDWTNVLVGHDPNEVFDSFSAEYNKHFEDCFP